MTYLPIGSVVTLKDGGRPLMITGRSQRNAADNTLWDYSACLYPEGVPSVGKGQHACQR